MEAGQVIGAGNSKATARIDTQAETIGIAREIACNQESEFFIHGTHERIQERN